MYNPTNPGYSTQNQTRFTPNYEPTISDNPYASSPYDLQKIPPPPPPPRQSNQGLLVTLVSVSCLVLVLVGAFVVVYVHSMSGSTQATHSTVQPFDATSIIRDFQAHGLPLDQLHYGTAINQFVGSGYDTVITTQSSALFVDPSFCTGPCDVGSVWLGVYNSPVDAQSEYDGLVSYRNSLKDGPGPGALASLVQSGRCVLIGEPATSEYAAILRSVCT